MLHELQLHLPEELHTLAAVVQGKHPSIQPRCQDARGILFTILTDEGRRCMYLLLLFGEHCVDALNAALTGNESSAVGEDGDIPDPPHRLLRGPCTRNTPAFVKGIERLYKRHMESEK